MQRWHGTTKWKIRAHTWVLARDATSADGHGEKRQTVKYYPASAHYFRRTNKYWQ